MHRVESLGATVRDFATGQDLVTTLTSEDVNPALIILDMEMPGLTGCQTARALRREGYAGAMALMTGTVTDLLESEARRSGCDCVLHKSAKNEELARIVKNALSNLYPDIDTQVA